MFPRADQRQQEAKDLLNREQRVTDACVYHSTLDCGICFDPPDASNQRERCQAKCLSTERRCNRFAAPSGAKSPIPSLPVVRGLCDFHLVQIVLSAVRVPLAQLGTASLVLERHIAPEQQRAVDPALLKIITQIMAERHGAETLEKSEEVARTSIIVHRRSRRAQSQRVAHVVALMCELCAEMTHEDWREAFDEAFEKCGCAAPRHAFCARAEPLRLME